MSIISEKVSYLRGLAEGMKISDQTNEGKLLLEIISVLGEVGDDLEYLEDVQDELSDAVFDLEDEVYGDYEDEDEDDEPLAITCPSCQQEFFLEEEELWDEEPLTCPGCGQEIELDFDCDCDCGCCDDE